MASNANTGLPPAGYRVGSQVPRKIVQPDGTTLDGYTVHFVTANGVAGTVWISEQDYSVDNVKAAISAKANILDAVSNIGS